MNKKSDKNKFLNQGDVITDGNQLQNLINTNQSFYKKIKIYEAEIASKNAQIKFIESCNEELQKKIEALEKENYFRTNEMENQTIEKDTSENVIKMLFKLRISE